MTNKEAAKRLTEMLKNANRGKYPNYPDHLTMPVKKYNLSTSNGLTRAVIAWIEAHGQRAIRVSSAGRYIDESMVVTDYVGFEKRIGSGTWVPSTTKRGAADISCTIYGKSVEIEIKIGRDTQSQDQKKYQQITERAGGTYLIIKTFEQFLQWWDETMEHAYG